MTPAARLRHHLAQMAPGPGRQSLERAVQYFGEPDAIYRLKLGEGRGLWFAWRCGLMVREDGSEEMERDPALYAETLQ